LGVREWSFKNTYVDFKNTYSKKENTYKTI
jgi:hypothetical protein